MNDHVRYDCNRSRNNGVIEVDLITLDATGCELQFVILCEGIYLPLCCSVEKFTET